MTAEMVCAACGRPVKRASPMQKYCVECSAKAHQQIKNKWARRHPMSPETVQRRNETLRRRRELQGRILSAKTAVGIAWPAELPPPDLVRLARIAVPFDWGYSKNAMWSMARGGHVYVREEQRLLAEAIVIGLRSKEPWPQRTTWLDILVQKPNHRGDAINVLDIVADAVKRAIGIDDRWFSIRRLEWQIVKTDPQLFIGVGQDGTEHQQACSFCGRLLSLDNFTKSRGNKMGVSRECRECSRSIDRTRRVRSA